MTGALQLCILCGQAETRDPTEASKRKRESAADKAQRLLTEGRVTIRRVDDRGVMADVRGDSGVHSVLFDPRAEMWSCDCEARGRCSHIQAVTAVVVAIVPDRAAQKPAEARVSADSW